ncbi:MAG: hypothetical protein K2N84_01085 [Clostridia bacterium]|nr:hypothetical protein [Clostridia bacterium]
MATIINISSVTDYSGEPPIVTDSNPVTTVVNQPSPTPIRTRYYYQLLCDNCCCNCGCCCCNCD